MRNGPVLLGYGYRKGVWASQFPSVSGRIAGEADHRIGGLFRDES
ncbi:hypothetical protein [Acetobacter persici]